ncbi:MAG: hypothetical protein JXA11_17185 [Phycisphaerae bacterium]|nr:hypothetical protein [Phycisphaerae bacterium]
MSIRSKSIAVFIAVLVTAITGFHRVVLAADAGAKSGETENLLPNPGFEEQGKGWTWAFWSGEETRGTYQWTADAHSGRQAVEIIGQEASQAGEKPRGLFYSPPVKCSPGIYEISGFYKTKGDVGVFLQIQTYDTEDPKDLIRNKANEKKYHRMKRSSDWKSFTWQLNLGKECKQLIVMLRGKGIGSVFFDDLKLRELNEPVQAFLFPGRWAYGENRAYIIDKNVAPIQFGFAGDVGKFTFPLQLEITAPSAVKLYSVLPMHKVDASADVNTYVVTIEKLGIKRNLTHNAWITLWAEVNEPLAESQLRWRVHSGEEVYSQKFAKLLVLPPLPEKQYARNFNVHFQWSLYTQVPKELWERVYQLYRSCGINCYLLRRKPDVGSWNEYCFKRYKEDGGKVILDASPGWHTGGNPAFSRKFGENWLVEVAGGGADAFEKLDNGFSAALADKVDGFLWDAEFMPHHLSYDKNTLAGFAEYMGLDEALVTEELVKTKYPREYHTYYNDYLGGKVIQNWAAYLKKLKPDALLIAQQGCGADGRYHDIAYYDVEGITHSCMTYTSGAKSWADMIEQTSDYAIQPMMPTTTTGLQRERGNFAQRSPESIRLDILTAAMLQEPGICFWPDLQRQMGTMYLWQMARASANIRSVEEFFTKGNRIDQKVTVEGLPETESETIINGKRHMIRYPEWRDHLTFRAFQMQKERLITVFNMNPEKTAYVRISAKIPWPEDGYKVYDAVSNTRLTPSAQSDTWNAAQLKQGVLVKIPPSEVVFLRITQEKENLPEKTVCVKDTEKEYKQRREQSKASNQGGEIREGNLKIAWDDMDNDGGLEVVMTSPVQKVWITPSGGRLWGWKTGGSDKNLIRQGETFGGCMDLFWIPEGARWQTSPTATYRVAERGVKDGKAYVTLHRNISTPAIPGLVLAKTYSIDETTADITVSLKITNESPEPVIRFSYWSHNGLSLGDCDKLVYQTDKGVFVQKEPAKIFIPRAGLPKDMIRYLSKSNHAPITGDWLATWDEQTKEAITIRFDNTPLLQIYKWSSDKGDKYTMEWMYQPVDLKLFDSWKATLVFRYQKNQRMNEKQP